MPNKRRSRSSSNLNKIYRYNLRLSNSKQRLQWMVLREEQRGAPINRNEHIRIENLQTRMDRLTLKRRTEVIRTYSNRYYNRYRSLTCKSSVSTRSSFKIKNREQMPLTRILSSPIVPVKVTNITIDDDRASIAMQPTLQTTNVPETDDDIIYPENIDDFRPYRTIARFRQATNKSVRSEPKQINFRTEPLLVGEQQMETLVLGLDSFAKEHGCELIFNDDNHQFNNSIYRASCGVVDLGSIHLLATNTMLTANFEFKINFSYDRNTVQLKEYIEQFVMDFCKAISTVLSCDTNSIRVFSIQRITKEKQTSMIEFGLTSIDHCQTEQWAQDLQNRVRFGFKNDKILQHVIPANYDYQWKSTIQFLKLHLNDFAPEYNFDYRVSGVEKESTRGNHPYYLPIGWFRHGLSVVDKYETDSTWLGCTNARGEWPVAYHGTKSDAACSAVKHDHSTSTVKTDLIRNRASEQVESDTDRPAIYVATHCEGGAYPAYTQPFSVPLSSNKFEQYTLVFQCRVRPENFTIHECPVEIGTAWRFVDSSSIRPYGILLKRETSFADT